MPKSYVATPLAGSEPCADDVGIIAGTDLEALMRAKEILGSGTTFRLREGRRAVITYRPAQDDAETGEAERGSS